MATPGVFCASTPHWGLQTASDRPVLPSQLFFRLCRLKSDKPSAAVSLASLIARAPGPNSTKSSATSRPHANDVSTWRTQLQAESPNSGWAVETKKRPSNSPKAGRSATLRRIGVRPFLVFVCYGGQCQFRHVAYFPCVSPINRINRDRTSPRKEKI